MKSWAELTDDEREVVKRLPNSARYSPDERKLTREWCIKCWNEQTTEARDA